MIKRLFILCLIPVLTGCAALLTPSVEAEFEKLKGGAYTLDKSHAALLFKVRHLGLSTYVGRFNSLDAELEFDPSNLAETRLTTLVDMTSLDINDDDLASDLSGARWLNTKVYPQAKFTTVSVTPITDSEFEFVGELDWRGVKKPISLKATFHGGANNILTGKYTLGFSAVGSFLRSDFGMDAYIPLVGDEITLEAYAEFQRN